MLEDHPAVGSSLEFLKTITTADALRIIARAPRDCFGVQGIILLSCDSRGLVTVVSRSTILFASPDNVSELFTEDSLLTDCERVGNEGGVDGVSDTGWSLGRGQRLSYDFTWINFVEESGSIEISLS